MWVKICGIKDVSLIEDLADLGPDAVGFNFYRGSRRAIAPEAAAQAVLRLPPEVEPVGVFVNQAADEIRSICESCGIRTAQLHGDETPEFAAELEGLRIIRVYRVASDGLTRVADDLQRCRQRGVDIRACLVEPHVEGQFGGTGTAGPWHEIATGWQHGEWPPLLLAGGLTPENVGEAVRTVHPWGVDVASGVESSPGVKDLARVAAFVAAARRAS